ncbi:hypothetical protein [Subtercola boreus]|uniref:hypothetical protein n=1 Tax=Subtercola boreus TaxID=120213 RepID=UPI0011C07CE6|nr:hypothetical protein [Subtercola boreus]
MDEQSLLRSGSAGRTVAMRIAGAAIVATLCLAATTACASGESAAPPTLGVVPALHAPSLLSGDFVALAPARSMSGAVVSADGSIAFTDSDTGMTAPLLWPRGTTVGAPASSRVVLLNGSIVLDAPLTMIATSIQAKELWAETEGVAECAPDPEQSVIVVTGLPGILMQQ